MKNWSDNILLWLKKDGIVILLYVLLLTIMTYPLVFRLGEIIPMHNLDTYTAMWQNWYLQKVFTSGFDLNETTYLFYPNGLDLTLMPRRFMSYPIWAFFNMLWGEPIAYNLTVLAQSLIKAYAMYRLILLFVPHRPSAWVGGAFFAVVPRILVGALQQPNTGSVEFIPVFMFFMILSLRHIREKPTELKFTILLMVIAGLAFSANLYMNIKIGIFAVFIGGIYISWVFVVHRLWRVRSFWIGITTFSIICLVLSMPILLLSLQYSDLDTAITDYWAPQNGLDIIHYLKADPRYPYFYNQFMASFDEIILNQSVISSFAQIGFVSIGLSVIAIIDIIRNRRDQLVWVIIVLFFFWLSLGNQIHFDGQAIDWLPTIYPFISDNPIISSLREPFRFQIIMLFGLSILISFGLQYIFKTFSSRLLRITTILFIVFMFFEISSFPIPYRSAEISSAFKYVREQSTGPIITLPLGVQQTAKYAMYAQISHELPIVEGKIGRMPEDAYDFILKDNLLLQDMSKVDRIQEVSDELLNNWESEIDELIELDFRYVLVQKLVYTGRSTLAFYDYQEQMFFINIEPDYETDDAIVYDLLKLRDNPPN